MQVSDERMRQMGKDLYNASQDTRLPEILRERMKGHSEYIYNRIHDPIAEKYRKK